MKKAKNILNIFLSIMIMSNLCFNEVSAEENNDSNMPSENVETIIDDNENISEAVLTIKYLLNGSEIELYDSYVEAFEIGTEYNVISPEIDNFMLVDENQHTISGVINEDTQVNVYYNEIVSSSDDNNVVDNNTSLNNKDNISSGYLFSIEYSQDHTSAKIIGDSSQVSEEINLIDIFTPNGNKLNLADPIYEINENGNYEFKITYSKDDIQITEIISIEINDILTYNESNNSLSINTVDNTYNVSTVEELENALNSIAISDYYDATIILLNDLNNSTLKFAGVEGKHVILKSLGSENFKIQLNTELKGNITVDNVYASGTTLFCNGFNTIFTENSEINLTGTLYGGGNNKTVDSTYVSIRGKGIINSSGLENVVIGGSYKGSVVNDVYVEIIGDITFDAPTGGHYITGANKSTRYGGDSYNGEPLYVGGNVTLILDVNPDNQNTWQNVSGTHSSHIYGNLEVIVKAGKFQGIQAQRGDAELSNIDGDVHIVAGAAEYEYTERIFRSGYNWGIYGAGEQIMTMGEEFKVGGNIVIDTFENLWGWDKYGESPSDLPSIIGAHNAEVAGNITINVHGSHIEDIIGVEDESVQSGSVTTDFESKVQGNITINATDIDLAGEGYVLGSWNYNGFVRGNVEINVDSGKMNVIETSPGKQIEGKSTINVTGNPNISLRIRGIGKTDTPDSSIINFDTCEAYIPYLYEATQVNINNNSIISLGSVDNKPFYDIYDLNINSNSSLTTNDKTATIYGNVMISDSSLITNGYLYVYETVNSKNSSMTFNDYIAIGYNYRSVDNIGNIVFNSNNDNLIFNRNNYLDKIYGDFNITGGTQDILSWLQIVGNYYGLDNTIKLPVYSGTSNYPNNTIMLEITGKASGNTDVYLVNLNDKESEGSFTVGKNYINALKISEDTFILANKNANNGEYYFKRVTDTKKGQNYDMWQIAKNNGYGVLYAFQSGTKGKGLIDEITNMLPIDNNQYYLNNIVYAILPSKLEIEYEGGKYKFEGYKQGNEQLVTSENLKPGADTTDTKLYIHFTGIWKYYNTISYMFKSTDGSELPDEILSQLPNEKECEYNTKIIPPAKDSFHSIQINNGVWNFVGWDKESLTVKNNDSFIGTWEFKKNTYDVEYEFISGSSGRNLPNEVKEQLPSKETVEHGSSVSPSVTNFNEVEEDDGKWIFQGWDSSEITNVTSNVKFTGTWEYFEYQDIEAYDLVAYEGGFGTDGNIGNVGNALPSVSWDERLLEYKVYIENEEWNISEKGYPFSLEYRDNEGNVVKSSARAGIYSLYVKPLEGNEEKNIFIEKNGLYKILYLPVDGLKICSVSVRDVTNNIAADTLSSEYFKTIYSYDSINPQIMLNSLSSYDFGISHDECNKTEPHAHINENTIFYKNGNTLLPVNNNSSISLLWDNLLPSVLGNDYYMNILHTKSLEALQNSSYIDLYNSKEINYDFKYIDLVDTQDGNLWVGTNDKDVLVYWPYPEGVTKDYEIALIDYDGLTRDYTVDIEASNLEEEINNSSANVIDIIKLDEGILFNVKPNEFGPFELIWQKNKEDSITNVPDEKPEDSEWDNGGPFTTDICGSIYDRWGNLIYEAPNCQVHDGYKVPNTGTK